MRLSTSNPLEELLNPAVEAAGYRLVRLRVMGGKTKTLQIMAERADGQMDVEDCAQLSRALSDVLEAADPIESDYVLEVSSPGIDRPLTRLEDFQRFAGHEVRIELVPGPAGEGEKARRRFKGTIKGVNGADVLIDMPSAQGAEKLNFRFAEIAEAKLVLTDRLIAESLKAQELRTKGAQAQN